MLSGPDDFRVLRFLISRCISSELVGERKNVLLTLSARNVTNVWYRLLKFFANLTKVFVHKV